MSTDAPAPGGPDRLRVLLAVHHTTLGGSQMNAIDLATGMRDRGHEIVVAGPDGPLVDLIRSRGLRFEQIALDRADRAVREFGRLRALVREVRPDILHAYELTSTMVGFFGPHWRDRVPMTMTLNTMSIPDFMPGSIPLQVCGPLIASEVRGRSGPVGIMEIPTDCVGQHPDFPGADFRAEVGTANDELLVVVVSRFARVLKQQGLETAIRAAARLAPRHRVRLVLVGDGPAMPDLRALADETNARAGREVVVLTGVRPDPRPAYAAADVVLGMGGSLLRAMAFGKPCVVQGENGFWRALDAATAREFRWHGFYGIGDGGTGEDDLVDILDRLLIDETLRKENADFALDLVHRFYSLDHAVDVQIDWYRCALERPVHPPLSDVGRTAAAVAGWFGMRVVRRLRGIVDEDMFNSPELSGPGIRAAVPASFDPEPVRPGPGGGGR